VQVVITETIQQNGVINFNDDLTVIKIDEDVGVINIPLTRTNGSDGTVGVYFDVIYVNASRHDVIIRDQTASFTAGEQKSAVSIEIVNDEVPELEEMFVIKLTKPMGGAVIGERNQMEVVINESDYPYGLFR